MLSTEVKDSDGIGAGVGGKEPLAILRYRDRIRDLSEIASPGQPGVVESF